MLRALVPKHTITRAFSQAGSLRVRNVSTSVQLEYTRNQPSDTSDSTKHQPLLILHGLFGSKQNWRAISKQLTRTLNRDTYCVDLRNHGDSPHQAPHTYAAMTQDIIRFVSDHQLGKPILIGHSMGGKVVMETALERPDLVSQLIVDDMVPTQLKLAHDFSTYVTKLLEIEEKNIVSQKEADEILATVEPDIGVRQFLLTNMKKVKETVGLDSNGAAGIKGVYRSRIPLELLGKSLEGVMSWTVDPKLQYTGPTLFIGGEKSPYVKPFAFADMRRYFPNHAVSMLDTGHWVHAEKPAEFMKLVEDFVKSNED
ncbi:hypothetical protein GGI07_004075 [Coemansia sp. Benny D115]|nr:hypothetical protein GGI07_004075 [Coemansia sp. Benny D115]